MRRLAICSGVVLLLAAAPASAVELAAGTYKAKFGGGCATMVVRSGGISYSFGPCGGAPTFKSSGSFDGKIIRIMEATLTVNSASEKSIRGRWKLGSYTETVTFLK